MTNQKHSLACLAICNGATEIYINQAYLQTQPTVNAIMMDVFDATPALLAFFSPRRFPILGYKESTTAK